MFVTGHRLHLPRSAGKLLLAYRAVCEAARPTKGYLRYHAAIVSPGPSNYHTEIDDLRVACLHQLAIPARYEPDG